MDPKLFSLRLSIPTTLFALLLYLDPEVKRVSTVILLILLAASIGTTLGQLLSEGLGFKPHGDEGHTVVVKEKVHEKIPAAEASQASIPNLDLPPEDDYLTRFSGRMTLAEYAQMRKKSMTDAGLKPPEEDNEEYASPLTDKEIEDITMSMEYEIAEQYFKGSGKVREAYLTFNLRNGKKDISPKCCEKAMKSIDKVIKRLGVTKENTSYVSPHLIRKGDLAVKISFSKNN